MTYSTTKPDGGPSPFLDVGQIQTNFSTFDTTFTVNHTPLNNMNQGDHEDVIFEKTLTSPVVNNNFDVLYARDATSAAGTEPQLFVKIPKFLPTKTDPTNATNAGMQLTYNQVNTAGPQYQGFFPGAFLFYSSTATFPFGTTITLIPAPTKILTIIAATQNTIITSPIKCSATILSSSTFKIDCSAPGGTILWMAIAQA